MRGKLSSEPTLGVIRDLLRIDGPGHALPDDFIRGLVLLVDCDGIGFNHLDSTAKTQYFSQGYDINDGDWLLHGLDWLDPEERQQWWDGYWDSNCSFPERAGAYHHVQLGSDFVTERRRPRYGGGWSGRKFRMVLPDGPGRTLRLIGTRESGSDFAEDDRFLLTLLMPHIERMYRTRVRGRAGAAVRLTPRQHQLVHQLRLGYTNAQIARRLGISEATVRTHLEHVYARLGVTNRVAAVVRAESLVADADADGDALSRR